MTIIEADSSHAGYISEFGSKSFIHSYQCTLPLDELKKYTNVAFKKSNILEEINNSVATYFICLDSKSDLCGYAKLIQSHPPICINSNSCIELQRLYVDSDYRGRGVGKLLELHSESFAKNRSISDIWLRVWDGNTVAQDIYKKWEFTIVGEEQYQVGKDKRTVLLMHKSLS